MMQGPLRGGFDQMRYSLEAGVNTLAPLPPLAVEGLCTYNLYQAFAHYSDPVYLLGGVCSLWLGHYFLRDTIQQTLMPLIRLERLRELKAGPPLASVSRVHIKDQKGLEDLLFQTALCPSTEWGTLLRAHAEGDIAIIDKIEDSFAMEERGLISERTPKHVKVMWERAEKEGYTGLHHYHPSGGARHYSIHRGDRFLPPVGWLNLLSFCHLGVPQLIGYNVQSTFIPESHSKETLLRATPTDVLRYLWAYATDKSLLWHP